MSGQMTVAEAGQKGGRVRAAELGHRGYQALGRKGGEATSERYGPEHYREIGRKGGIARASKNKRK